MIAMSVKEIENILQNAFQPTKLQVVDDSHLHVGHPGARNGAGHYTVNIVSEKFYDKSLLEQHRMVYACLQAFIPDKIHALSIHSSDK